MTRVFGWLSILMGVLRLVSYFLTEGFQYGFHHNRNLSWMIVSFVSGVILLWYSRKETRQSD